jgi:predicted nucleic acid-binding Zn ribbon protein
MVKNPNIEVNVNMPVYTYRREDGTTFDIRQKFTDAPLAVDPETGQKVVRLVQRAGVIFKGSGFYVTDNKSSSNGNGKAGANGAHSSNGKNAEANGSKSDSESTKSAENGKATPGESKSSTAAK